MIKHPVNMFFPSGTAIRNLVLINILVISTVILTPPTIMMLQAPAIGETSYRYSNTINYIGFEYWLSIETIDRTSQSVRISNDIRQVSLIILGQNKQYYTIPVFMINETEIGYSTAFWKVSLMKVNTNFAYIRLNYESWEYTGLNGNYLTKNFQDFIIRFKYNNALSLEDLDSSLSSLQIINLQNMENISLSETYQSEFYEGSFVGVFRNNRFHDDFWTYLRNDTYHDYFVIAGEMFGAMDSIFFESEIFVNPMWNNIKGERLELGKFQTFDIGEALYDEFGEDLGLISMHSIKRGHLLLIDSLGTFHFSGETIFINEAEGNSTGRNQPEFLAINPISGQFQFWDIVPAWEEFAAYPNILDLGGGEIIMLVYSAVINGFYENPEYHPDFERTEDYDPVWDWYRDKEVQVIRFNPLNPINENYIQFEKSISGTESHTIEYPRPIGVQTIANSSALLGTNTAVSITTDNNLYVFLQQYKTESGVTEELYYGDNGIMWTSSDQSIIMHSFDLTDNLNYTGYSKIIGPDEDIQDWYDGGGNDEEFEYPKLYGWDIISIESAFLTGNYIELYFHGHYDIVGDFARTKLRRININIEEDLI
jgi:hypothetical protein